MKNPNDPTIPQNEGETLNRRELLKALGALGGVAASAAFLPSGWIKPLVETGNLPAHARATVMWDLAVDLYWSLSGTAFTSVNLDLHVIDPADSSDVFNGATQTLSGVTNVICTPDGNATESTTNLTPGVLVTGTYQIFVDNVGFSYRDWITTAKVTITVNGIPTVIDIENELIKSCFRVADVTYPPGTLTNRLGEACPP